MSVVPSTGLLRKLYQDGAQNIESQPSPFWQTWLRRAFHEENYTVTCGMPRDESLTRVETEVHRYDESDDTLSTVLCIELRIFSASVRQVESQALDAARRCIRANNLRSVNVMTTVGASFRCWTVYNTETPSLVSFNGGSADANQDQYIDADSYEAEALTRFVDTVKNHPPLCNTPVPS
ncbi:Ff.00g062440.m01.CDS01 [Fusarium sp. VM40]|nr:Ff.00g062440.m01.CDS01 [Fusarium sp. VM40]